jgi:hypothetical protein
MKKTTIQTLARECRRTNKASRIASWHLGTALNLIESDKEYASEITKTALALNVSRKNISKMFERAYKSAAKFTLAEVSVEPKDRKVTKKYVPKARNSEKAKACALVLSGLSVSERIAVANLVRIFDKANKPKK